MTEVEKLSKKYNWNLPVKCPLCKTKLEINETHSRIFCPNDNCYSYVHSRILKYLNKMGIMHIAGAIIDTLIDEGFISEVYDLYTINWNDVAKLEGFGKISCNKYKKEISDHTNCTVSQFLAGFNIAGMGERQIEKMIGNMSLQEVLSSKADNFITNGIGDLTANKFVKGLTDLKSVILKTSKYVNFIEEDGPEITSNSLNGLSFCFTGKIYGYTRNDLEELVISNGGSVGSVTSKLNYLCSDDKDSTSGKMLKAKKLGIPIITSKQFLKMISN